MFGYQNCFTNAFQNIQNSLNAVSNRLSTLSSSIISSTNLPVYVQNYTFSSSSGVLTPYFTIVGGLPTNQSLRRTWNLVTAGSLSSGSKPTDPLIFTYDFSGVVSLYSVTIDGTLAGTLTIDGQVYDAATYFSTPTYNYNKNILTLTLNVSNISWNNNGGDFSYNLFLADTDSTSGETLNLECIVQNGLFIQCFFPLDDQNPTDNGTERANGNLIQTYTIDGGTYSTVNINVYFIDTTKCGCATLNDVFSNCNSTDDKFTKKSENLQIEVVNSSSTTMDITVNSYSSNYSRSGNYCYCDDNIQFNVSKSTNLNKTATAKISNTYKYFTCYCSNSNQYFTAD